MAAKTFNEVAADVQSTLSGDLELDLANRNLPADPVMSAGRTVASQWSDAVREDPVVAMGIAYAVGVMAGVEWRRQAGGGDDV